MAEILKFLVSFQSVDALNKALYRSRFYGIFKKQDSRSLLTNERNAKELAKFGGKINKT